MPPSEHVLIDKLSYRGAKVVMSNWLGGDSQLWVVLEGKKPLTNNQRKFLRQLIELWFEDEAQEAAVPETCAEATEGVCNPKSEDDQ